MQSLLKLCDYLWNISTSLWTISETLRIGRRISSEEFWQGFADEFVKRVQHDFLIDRFTCWQLSRIEVKPNDTVLDCGCGFGRLTIPLAKKCKLVYAVDQCEKLLEYLKHFAEKEGVLNKVKVVYGKWEKLRLGIDIPNKVDVVVVSHSLEVGQLSEALKFLVNVTGRCCHIFHDFLPLMFQEYHEVFSQVLGEDVLSIFPSPAAVIVLALTCLGVSPNVEVYVRKSRIKLRSIEELLHGRLSRVLPVDKEPVRSAILKVFTEHIVETGKDYIIIEASRPIAHIWWCNSCT